MQGRASGLPGHRKAAEYVAREFELAGLKPAGTSSYFQRVPIRTSRIIEARSHLVLRHDGAEEALDPGRDVLMSGKADFSPELYAPATLPAALRAHYQSYQERWRALRAAGAVGIASIPNPRAMDMPWERLRLLRFAPP
jgi:hypothetical protein